MVADIKPAHGATHVGFKPYGDFARVKNMSAVNDLQDFLVGPECFKRDGTSFINRVIYISERKGSSRLAYLLAGWRHRDSLKKGRKQAVGKRGKRGRIARSSL